MQGFKKLTTGCVLLVLLLWITSCRQQKEITYFQSPEDTTSTNQPSANKVFTFEPTIRPNDILKIYVSSINKEASSFFNPLMSNTDTKVDDPEAYGYLVDAQGLIELPIIGSVKVAGLTVPLIRDTLKVKLSKYLENPTVRVIFDNFKVTVLGEVENPGVYLVRNERITVPEALGLAGDMTIFGKRSNVLIIREENNNREFAYINLTKRDVFESPYFFLHPNDVVYVEPAKGKTAASDNFYRIAPLVISTLTLFSVLLIRFDQVN